ncbi:Uncharacterised protein [Mycobacteroides abscessus subsp. abscessus]|nr:Uncharacterised protein [Mycobacteroides abscessus subsp. abscessus]
MEEDRVLVDVLQKVLPRRRRVLVELDLALCVIQIEHRVECVIVQLAVSRAVRSGHWFCSCRGWRHGVSFQNSSSPSSTCSTSSAVPMSSKRYRYGTSHLAEMTLPA